MEEKQLLIKALDRLEKGDILGSVELLGECYSFETEEALDILSERGLGGFKTFKHKD